jgi:nucleotide-binding universal stress UspA family protein
VFLTGWRILAQPQRRVLAVDGGRGSTDALAAAAGIARALGASLRILGIARDDAGAEALRSAIAGRSGIAAGAEVRIRVGDRDEQIATELADTYYHLCVAAVRADGDRRRGAFVELHAIERSGTPVLYVRGPLGTLKSLLLCTAVGEPGRVAVRFGGWLATRLGARVRLLHVSRERADPPPWVLAHLERGVRTLYGQGVLADYRVRVAATPAEGILAEAREGENDLVVIGRHAPAPGARAKEDVTMQILRASDRPILVVSGNA